MLIYCKNTSLKFQNAFGKTKKTLYICAALKGKQQ
ncbi:hypothetical protein SGRA_4157 [Saprospira grandis str. Lewin]|uniref:Uncharacterized protein n=1 Tax=Saprospira grandis (strain Lewin) TaxID=984262 RepID=H6L8R6_SAPGL|nr:hypothetical protein SGRA_4157 [Saprospira grandis str. Lewin]